MSDTSVSRRAGAPHLLLPFEATDFERIPAVVDQAWNWARERGGVEVGDDAVAGGLGTARSPRQASPSQRMH